MPNGIELVPGALCDLHIIVADGDRRIANDLKDMQLVSITPGEIRIGEPLRFGLAFRKNLRPIRYVFADPLNSMVRIKDQIPGIHGPLLTGWKDMTVRNMALKLAEEIKILPEAQSFVAEDKRSYRVLTIAKVAEEKAVQGVYVPRRGEVASRIDLPVNTTKRFYFRTRWYNNPDGEEVSFRCSSYKALRGKDLSTVLPRSDYRAVVRMVLPKSEGSPLGALLVEIIKK